MKTGYIYENSIADVISFQYNGETFWELKSNKIAIPNRGYTTKAQAYIALGILEHLYSQANNIDFMEFEFILKATNRMCSGKSWITE